MTDSPSDTETTESALDAFAADFAAKVGAERWSTDFDTVHVYVARDQWVEAATIASISTPVGPVVLAVAVTESPSSPASTSTSTWLSGRKSPPCFCAPDKGKPSVCA